MFYNKYFTFQKLIKIVFVFFIKISSDIALKFFVRSVCIMLENQLIPCDYRLIFIFQWKKVSYMLQDITFLRRKPEGQSLDSIART